MPLKSNPMEKIFSTIILLFLSFGCQTAFDSKDPDRNPGLLTNVDKIFEGCNNSNSPGCALAIVKDGKILYKRGYGMADLEHDIPISSNTVFYVGSVSKQFTAMCLLLLEEEGKLSLDDNIRKYLPQFPEYNKPITIRQLIHHSSGIRDYLLLWYISGKDYLDYMSEDEVYRLLCSQKELDFTPGERHAYSNSGYFLASLIIRKVSGKSLREYAEENIFKPLGMKNSIFNDSNKNIIKNRAFGYTPLNEGNFGNVFMRFDLVGSGGLYTTIEDLYLWDQNFYHNKLGKGGQTLINKMCTNGKLNDGKEVNYAFGLINGQYQGFRTIQHGGSLGGYRAHILRFPEQALTIIVLSNLSIIDPGSLANKVADIFLD
jgi:CubicO group peptidase (beta-lactamase class C family)